MGKETDRETSLLKFDAVLRGKQAQLEAQYVTDRIFAWKVRSDVGTYYCDSQTLRHISSECAMIQITAESIRASCITENTSDAGTATVTRMYTLCQI